MNGKLETLSWHNVLDSMDDYYSINDDFILFDKPVIKSNFSHPFKSGETVAIFCQQGVMKGKLGIKHYTADSPSLIIVLSEQVIEYEYISPDFSGHFLVLSKSFLDSLNIEERFSAFLSAREKPCISLGEREVGAMETYFHLIDNMLASMSENNPYRLEIARNLTRAFFYGFGGYHHIADTPVKTKNEILMDDFFKLVQETFHTHRTLEFYADKLSMTPKYMSSLIKQVSGRQAGEWIEETVIIEAKALLKSTNMTIQQISDKLNFPNQSFFGKYFKRLVGMSPKEYRK